MTNRAVNRAILAVVGAIALSGCQTTGSPKVDALRTKADVLVATNAKKLADYCALVQLGMGTLSAFVHDPKVVKVLRVAQPAVATYCAGPPPADVAQAVQTLMAIYGSVVQAQAQAGV
jgi:hypothetical protein